MYKIIYFIFISFFTIHSSKSQDLCFINNGLKNSISISFTIQNNVVMDGEWESGDYTGNTSAEVVAFKGKKVGNKLMITFVRSIPYSLPQNTKDAIWTMENGILKIPMIEKNYNTKKFENTTVEFSKCESVKADDYETNMPETYPCNCDAYVIDTDKKGLNVRENGNKNATIIAKIPFNSEGTMVHLKNTNGSGWVTVNKATDINDKPVMKKEGFVFAQKLGVSVSGYQEGKVDIYESPNVKSKVVHSIISGNDVTILDCKGKWLKIKHTGMNVVGWLKPEDQCANPATSCN